MKKLLDNLKQIDAFGVQINLLTSQNEAKFQSRVGGFISLISGSISFAYFLYVIIQWIDNEIPPNIRSKQQTTSYSEFTWSDPLIQFSIQDFQSGHPFSREKNILIPLLFKLKGGVINEDPIILFNNEIQENVILLSNGTLVLNNAFPQSEDYQLMTEYLIVFAGCSNQIQINNIKCADQKTIDEYFSQNQGYLFLTIALNQLNYEKQYVEGFAKQYYQAFDPSKPMYSQVMLKQQETIIDDGLLFKNKNYFQFLNNYELIHQQVDQKFIPNTIKLLSNGKYDLNVAGAFLLRMDNIQIFEEAIMPKLGEVLAQIGSIVQLIFLLKHVALFYNNKLLESEMLHQIISIYYPEFKNVKLNLFNKFQSNSDLKQIKIPIQDLNQKYQDLLKKAKEKCRLINLLYETSRIQFVLEQKFGQQILINSHSLGGKVTKGSMELYCESNKESNKLSVKPLDQDEDLANNYLQDEPLELLLIQI